MTGRVKPVQQSALFADIIRFILSYKKQAKLKLSIHKKEYLYTEYMSETREKHTWPKNCMEEASDIYSV